MSRIVSWSRYGLVGAMACITPSRAQQAPMAEEDIREIRDLIEVPVPQESSHALWWIISSVIVVALTAWLILRAMRARSKETSALGLAMKRLREIESRQLEWSDETYAIELTDVLRRFFVTAYRIDAPQRTSQEFLHECMRMALWSDFSLESLRNLLRACDEAKFASGALTTLARQDMLSQVRELLLMPISSAEEQKKSSAS